MKQNEIVEPTGEEEQQREEQQENHQWRPAGGEMMSEKVPLPQSLPKTQLTESAGGWRSGGAIVCQTTWRLRLPNPLKTHTRHTPAEHKLNSPRQVCHLRYGGDH